MVTILTQNLNLYATGHGPWQERREEMLALLTETRPDVVAFQAVRSDPTVEGGVDQAAQIGAHFPEYRGCFFHPSMSFPDGSQEGSALLSRFPMSALQVISLNHQPGIEDPNRRAILHARVELPDGPLHVLNAHFSWVPAQALENVLEFLEYARELTQRALLVGDFNSPPDSAAIRQLIAAGWQDGWAAFHPGDPGFTFESSSPRLRIDYALANAALFPRIRAVKVLRNGLESSGEAGGGSDQPPRYASDHFGLLVEIEPDAVI